jgi:hypothetical protein
MPAANLGLAFPWEVSEAIMEDLTEVATEWRYINMYPLFTRLPQIGSGQIEFQCLGSTSRPDTVQVTVAAVATDTVLTLADVTYLHNGDTLELTFADDTVEMMEIVADPNEAASQVTVLRGDAGTTAGVIPINTVLRIVSNTRTGGEKWQKAISPRHWRRANWIQSLDHPVEVSGVLQDTANYRLGTVAPGAATPLDAYRMRALDNLMADLERMIVYQRGVAPTASDTKRTKTKGIRQQCQDAGSYIRQPTNYAAYTPYDLERDIGETPAGKGGSPNLIFISKDWKSGMSRWKMPLVRVDMGVTEMNVEIDAFSSGFAPSSLFIVAPKFKRGTLFAANDADMALRFMRRPTWKPRGNAGDTFEGDVIARYGVQVDNPEQQVFLEGVTGFAAA